MGVVEVGQESEFRVAEVTAIQVQRIQVQLVDKAHAHRLAVFGVNHRARERAVEPIDRARRQGARARKPVQRVIHAQTVPVDRQHFGRRKTMLIDLQLDLITYRLGQTQVSGRALMRVRVIRIHALVARLDGIFIRMIIRVARFERHRDREQICERLKNERAGRVDFVVDSRKRAGAEAIGGHDGRSRAQAQGAQHLTAAQSAGADGFLEFRIVRGVFRSSLGSISEQFHLILF